MHVRTVHGYKICCKLLGMQVSCKYTLLTDVPSNACRHNTHCCSAMTKLTLHVSLLPGRCLSASLTKC
jgi:hypothetical protein